MRGLRWAIVIVLATAAAFAIHVFYGRGWANDYIQHAAQLGRFDHIIREPYPAWIVVLAFLTALLPMTAKIVGFALLRDRLPGSSGVVKGLCFTFLLLAFKGEVVRYPAMAIAVGSPLDLMIVQNSEPFLIALATGILIGVLTPPLDPNLLRAGVQRVFGKRVPAGASQ